MKFVDEYTFTAHAGDGGDGVVRWRREKFVPKGGPNGGNGGKGGDVVLRAVRDINRLSRMTHITRYDADRGQDGGDSSKTGRGGEDLVLELPIGSIVTSTRTGVQVELLADGEERVLLTGGEGGLGNEHFKSSSNQQPRQCTKGAKGEEGTFMVELRVIADIGLVGLPNVGKTSLLNALTNADRKVGAYEFTTLDPNLGVYHNLVIADIPGLIEGASEGKGLGHKFLRHISRTRLLVHCVSLEREQPLHDYEAIRHELEAYEGLSEKPGLIVLTKTDTVDSTRLAEVVAEFSAHVKDTLTVSVLDDDAVKTLGDHLARAL